MSEQLYKTGKTLKRTLRVAYPASQGTLALRTELDWGKDVKAIRVSEDGAEWTFELEAKQPFLYFKPVLLRKGELHWAVGENNLVLMGEGDSRISYPFFFSPDAGTFTPLLEFPSKTLGRNHRLKVYLPPGYRENTEARYPVAYMQDGQNLFFPEEAFMGRDWGVSGTKDVLRSMGAAEEFIVIGIYSGDRMREYTLPGYETYVRALVEEIIPAADLRLRTKPGRRFRMMWGSSLGGVVSFFGPWQYPDVFAGGICMSSTFSYQDDLIERVLGEEPRDVAYYLDSGWPGDNYETTLNMAMALVSRGWVYGRNLFHLSFPMARHSEADWGMRLHLPIQLITGSVARASRLRSPILRA